MTQEPNCEGCIFYRLDDDEIGTCCITDNIVDAAQETVLGTYTEQIRKAALAMVDTLDHGDANLPRLLDADDTLIDAVKKNLCHLSNNA